MSVRTKRLTNTRCRTLFWVVTGFVFLGLPCIAVAQFSPRDYQDFKSAVGSAEKAPEGEAVTPESSLSAANVCSEAKSAYANGGSSAAAKSNMVALRQTASELVPDAKSQFETATEYEIRQTARKTAWAGQHPLLVLPTPINSGADVYNAERELYTMGLSGGGLTLKPGGWDTEYQTGRGVVSIKLNNAFPSFDVKMAAPDARQFFERSAEYELVFVARPTAPYVEQEPYRQRYSLLAAATCRFVRRKADQKIIYFYSP